MDIAELCQLERDGVGFDLLYFWGHRPLPNGKLGTSCLSPWWSAPFEIDGETFATAEHYTMVEKARLFGDEGIARHILETTAPEQARALGREIRGFDQATWVDARRRIAVAGNLAKFTQRPELGVYLTQHTGEKVLVYASPTDRAWGIGLAANDIRARRPSEWRGRNLLGFALMEVRETLRGRFAA